jgi:tetratricopeptide (TPR) repeat protein
MPETPSRFWSPLRRRVSRFWYLLRWRVSRFWSWITKNFARHAAFLVLGVLIWALIAGYVKEESRLLVLLLILGAAIFIQIGDDLLERLRKVGPVEFFESRARPLDRLMDLEYRGGVDKLSEETNFWYQEVDSLISSLQFVDFEGSSLVSYHDLHRMIYGVASIAHDRGDLPRAIDRLEYLMRASKDGFKPYDTFLRCSRAYLLLAETYDRTQREQLKRRQELFEKALHLTDKALAVYKDDCLFYHFRAYAQDELGWPLQAVRSNEKSLENSSGKYAPARYNKAISQAKLGWYEKAYASLCDLAADDLEIRDTMATAREDPELKPLWEIYPDEMKAFFEERKDW